MGFLALNRSNKKSVLLSKSGNVSLGKAAPGMSQKMIVGLGVGYSVNRR